MIVPYYNRLVKIRRALEKADIEERPNFPKNCCDLAMVAVKNILGLEGVRGIYSPLIAPHNWNHDPGLGLFIDLTLDQFDGVDQDIVIISDKTKLFKVDKEKTEYISMYPCNYEDILAPFYKIYYTL